jgi:ketosteroid isomerase-like protein
MSSVEGVMNVFADDFVSVEYGRPTAKGKEALADWRAALQSTFSKYNCHLVIITDEIKVSGEMAYERGTVKLLLHPKSGGEALTEKHRFLDVWQKRSGEWKLVDAMSNN